MQLFYVYGPRRTSTGLPVHVMQQLRYDVQSKAGGAPFDCATTCQGNDQQKYKAYLREKHTSACYILRGDGAHSIFYDLDLARRECSSSNQQYAWKWACGAILLVPLTNTQLCEAGVQLKAHNIVVLQAELGRVEEALRSLPRRKRPMLNPECHDQDAGDGTPGASARGRGVVGWGGMG